MTCLPRLGSLVLLTVLITTSLPPVGATFSQPPIPCSNEFMLGQPTAPALLAPANGTLYAQTWPSFSWSAVQGATNYTLEIAGNSGFDDQFLLVYSGINVTAFGPEMNSTMQELQAWYWRVRAANESGYGPYSEIWMVFFKGTVIPINEPDYSVPTIILGGIAAIVILGVGAYRVYSRKESPEGMPEE